MEDFLFSLASNKFKKLQCPKCHKKDHWQRYYNVETGEVLPEQYGRCDNASKCREWVIPSRGDFKDELIPRVVSKKPRVIPPSVNIPKEVLIDTLKGYDKNTFIQYLATSAPYPFPFTVINKIIELYFVGTVGKGYMYGGTAFPFINANGNIRTIQIKQFDNNNSTVKTSFLHTKLEYQLKNNGKPIPKWLIDYNKQESKIDCYFGEHLLKQYPRNPIILVEAPKSAFYGTLYFGLPKTDSDFLWLATYSLGGFTLKKSKVLQGRNVLVYPDLSEYGKTFELWSEKAKEFEKAIEGTQFIVADLIETLAPKHDRTQGKDIADFLIKLDWRKFRKDSTVHTAVKISPPKIESSDCTNDQEQPRERPLLKVEGESINTQVYNSLLKNEKQKETTTKTLNEEDSTQLEAFDAPQEKEIITWEKDILELETFLNNTTLPTTPIKLETATTVTDAKSFITVNLKYIKRNNGNLIFKPYLNRLHQLKRILTVADAT
ncbi:DUF6965 family protein [Urechidicola vernalis]|uniref:DUF6371 domain-containing protein n=1 Tax=Urechidicola vernalis TaxID=3075600 RepID=A0ABU2Y8H6_9FLAO|nr:DUF6371 domain-containing protein [Urechidicola sp. P050]MDT0554042.1 DUF6371 domain-containing protein [Urechidicola sp. P050]